MGKLSKYTDAELAKAFVDNCEIKNNSQAELARQIGVSDGRLCMRLRELKANGAIDAYKKKLAEKPMISLTDSLDEKANAIRLIKKYLLEAENNDDKKALLQFLKPYIDMIKIENPEPGVNINISMEQHLNFLVQLVLDYVPVEKHEEVKAKYEEYKKTVGGK